MSSKVLLRSIQLWLLIVWCSSQILDGDMQETIQTVRYGKTAILKCSSNDKDHNFMFWHKKHSLIGPYSKFDYGKYDYEVLSGNLTIKVCGFLDFETGGMNSVIDLCYAVRGLSGCQWQLIEADEFL